ncbi:hypothetical protein M514_02586 [Trichuris suis]|uniref:Uncharacterized protein n=1 Tax=Trichuris suis TaxID=68888 RepID=A0A085NNG3_9BILA|nr:hypothetical protein M513_02586 [Trichuris suis]KFD71009.1 hypothetical protein M514_02586 [Trichuris suis]
MENRAECAGCLRCLRPAEWIPSQTVFARTVLCSSEPTREYIQGTTSSFAPKRVMRYTKRECYVKAITSPYFTTRNRNRYSTKTIVESKVALRENISQHGPTKPSMGQARPARLRHDVEGFTDYGRQLKITDYMPHCNNCAHRRVHREEATGSLDGNLHTRPWEPPIRKEPFNRQAIPMDPFDFTYCL